jgi:hypothetical protein
MKCRLLLVFIVGAVLGTGLSTEASGATLETIARIDRVIASCDPYGYVPEDQRQLLSKMIAYAVDKDAPGLVDFGKKCHADGNPRLRQCLSWCLYLVDPTKYASQFADVFSPADEMNAIVDEFEWSGTLQRTDSPDPFAGRGDINPYTCLGQIAGDGNKTAIEKLLELHKGEGGENSACILDAKYGALQKCPEAVLSVAAERFEQGKGGLPTGLLDFLGQERIDAIKASLRLFLPLASPAERGIIEDFLNYYNVGPPGWEDEAGYTLPPYKQPLSAAEREHLLAMKQYADSLSETDLEEHWNGGMDRTLQSDRVLVLAHQWYLYSVAPKKWRDAFVESFPTDFDGIGAYYRISCAYPSYASSGSPEENLRQIAEEGNTQAIERLVAGLPCWGPPGVEVRRAVALVLERQPEKTIRALAAAQDGREWVAGLPADVYAMVRGQRFVALRKQLSKMERKATEREKRILRGFLGFSTQHLGNLPPEEVVVPAVP